jgi:hypothetical protein
MVFQEKPRKHIGRPSKYKKEYCQMCVDHMAQGLSFESFAGSISVSVDALNDWCTAHEEFYLAKKEGNAKRLEFNEKLLTDIALGKVAGNVTAAIFILKNQGSGLAWKDKTEQKLDVDARVKTGVDFGDRE